MTQPGLFHLDTPPPASRPALSPDQRRRQRQAQAILSGLHPLTAALRYPIRLHPDAPRNLNRDTPGPRCGNCWHRALISTNGNRSWAKCLYTEGEGADTVEVIGPPRVTHGAGTDVAAWWPACTDYSPGDPKVSPDAARYIPERT